MDHKKPRGMNAINQILSGYAGQPATLAELMVCFKTSATLRRVWKQARAEMGPAARTPAQPQQPQAHTEQVPEQRPPSPRPAAWGNAILNDGGGAEWGDGATPAKAEEPAVKSEQPSEPIKTFGSGSWG